MMLTDPNEIRIISTAKQKNVRDHRRSRVHFSNIFEDFFNGVRFEGTRVIDLGPGHYDFGVLARDRGASEIVGLDNDPAVVELGLYKGMTSRHYQLKDLADAPLAESFDGVFCKFSVNAFWFWRERDRLARYCRAIGSLCRPGGWAWIAPWNGVPKMDAPTERDVLVTLETQRAAFVECGFRSFELSPVQASRYGVTGAVANHALFTLNLEVPHDLLENAG